jgi:type II secretion system protein G
MNTKSKGFTLIELLVVVAIIGILATVVLSSLSSARESARDAKRLSDIKTIQTALEMYANDNNGKYPTISWAGSHADSWADLEGRLGTTLPVDPINTSTSTRNRSANQGNFVYSYKGSGSSSWCYGSAYMLVFNLEGKNGDGDNDGVTRCDGAMRNNGDSAFTVGMNGDGSLITPDLSGTSK